MKQKGYKTPSWVAMQFKGVTEFVPANRIARRIQEAKDRKEERKKNKENTDG